MKCSKCKQLLVEFSEGRLEGELEQEIRKHISDCGACQQDLDDFRSGLRLMDDARSFENIPRPPADFAEQVMNRVRQNHRGYSRGYSPFRRRAFGITAMCCLLGLGMILLFHGEFLEKQSPAPVSDGAPTVETETPGNILSVDHMKRELVRMLDQTLEVIERGEQEWEIEI